MTVARAARMGLCEASRQKQSDGDDRLHGLFLIFDVRKSDIKLPAGRVGADSFVRVHALCQPRLPAHLPLALR